MTNSTPSRFSAATYTMAPAIAGMMLFNLVTWTLAFSGQYPAMDSDERFVLTVVALSMSIGIFGACHATYQFIRTHQVAQPGLWSLCAAACVTGELPGTTLNVLPLSVGLDIQLQTSSIGVNFLGVGLLVAYTATWFSKQETGSRT